MPTNATFITLESPIVYDYIFAGSGVSASLLLLELHYRKRLDGLRILLIDPINKNIHDKTYCFWAHDEEPIAQQLKLLIKHRWSNIELDHAVIKNLAPLRYNHISSQDLHAQIQQLRETYQWDSIHAPVESISRDKNGSYVVVNGTRISSKKIFDSRTPKYQIPTEGQTHIYQSFIGWIIETEHANHKEDTFRLMDFNVAQDGHTQFIYVLPFSPTRSLVEVTRFGSEIIGLNEAEQLLDNYIKQYYGNYTIKFSEEGCIPMSNTKIENEYIQDTILLGSRNYKIKPSTGYAFKSMFYHAVAVADSLENAQDMGALNLHHGKANNGRFAFYDSLLLQILDKRPQEGKGIFVELFNRVEITVILKFLDEKTSLKEDIKLFANLTWRPFLQALFEKTSGKSWFRPIALTLFTLILFLLGNDTITQNIIGYGAFFIGLIYVGIPHGAVDHLLETGQWDVKKAPRFIVGYLFQIAAMGIIWYLFPTLALLIFIGYSSWHFGQADGKQWQLSPALSLMWGLSILLYILGTHAQETNIITASIGQLTLPWELPYWSLLPWLAWSLVHKKIPMAFTILWLTISSQLPLLFAFGLYFIGQHSLTSWNHITAHLKQSNWRIWLQALPFHLGAWLLLMLFYFLWASPPTPLSYDLTHWGTFFIFIACISLPHAISMHFMYRQKTV